MKPQEEKRKYIAFLRGINVGGHHKVPMAELRKEMAKLGFENTTTILNSGNVIFDSKMEDLKKIEQSISVHLEKHFNFPIPTFVRKAETIRTLFDAQPFKKVKINKDIRWYISFLKKEVDSELKLPWKSSDNAYQIINKTENNILSVLDLSISKTPKAMEVLVQNFGKDITTRNWNTIEKIVKKL